MHDYLHIGTLAGCRVMRLRPDEGCGLELDMCIPLKESGVYAIGENRSMKGYFLRGSAGELLSLTEGRRGSSGQVPGATA